MPAGVTGRLSLGQTHNITAEDAEDAEKELCKRLSAHPLRWKMKHFEHNEDRKERKDFFTTGGRRGHGDSIHNCSPCSLCALW